MHLAYLPSPSQGVWHLGPIPIRAYALCIITGVAAAVWLTRRRWSALGGNPEHVADIALWAVPFGIVGGRLYHVITDPELHFEPGRQPVRALYIRDGGLDIWGAVALGAVGAWIGCRRHGIRLPAYADALAGNRPVGHRSHPLSIISMTDIPWVRGRRWKHNPTGGGPTVRRPSRPRCPP